MYYTNIYISICIRRNSLKIGRDGDEVQKKLRCVCVCVREREKGQAY